MDLRWFYLDEARILAYKQSLYAIYSISESKQQKIVTSGYNDFFMLTKKDNECIRLIHI